MFLNTSVYTALAAQNATITTEAFGLSTVYIAVARNNAEGLTELTGLLKYSYVVFGLVLGLPDYVRASEIKPCLPQDTFLNHDRYNLYDSEYTAKYEINFGPSTNTNV